MTKWNKIRITFAFKPILSIFLAIILILQVFTLSQINTDWGNQIRFNVANATFMGSNDPPTEYTSYAWDRVDKETCTLKKHIADDVSSNYYALHTAYKAGFKEGLINPDKVPPVPLEFRGTIVGVDGYTSGYKDAHFCLGGFKQESCPEKPDKEIARDTLAEKSSTALPNFDYKIRIFDKSPWRFSYQLDPNDGLVLNYVLAGTQKHFEKVSVPLFVIQTGSPFSLQNPLSDPKIIRFDAKCDKFSNLSDPVQDPNNKNIYRIHWGYEKEFKEEYLKGILTINYEIVVRTDSTTCEFVGKLISDYNPLLYPECYRFIPKVSYKWEGTTPETLKSFTAIYKLDYGNVGIALDKNSDNAVGNFWYNTGRISILTNETLLLDAGSSIGSGIADSIHTANPGQTVFIPGCRFSEPFIGVSGTDWTSWISHPFKTYDCNHMHWRWGATGTLHETLPLDPAPNVDPMIDTETDKPIEESKRGTPYFLIEQKIDIAIVEDKLKDNPVPVTDPFKEFDGEEIARTAPCAFLRSPDSCNLISADDVTIWYKATAYKKNSDSFFKHGTYVVDPTNKVDKDTIKRIILPPTINVDPALQGYLNDAAMDKNWLAEGTLLSPDNGKKVFADLSKAVQLLQDEKKNVAEGDKTVQTLDLATSQILFSAQSIVLNTINSAAGNIRQAYLSPSPTHALANVETSADVAVPSTTASTINGETITTTESELGKILSSNKDLDLAREYYLTALNTQDLSKSTEIVDNLMLSWIHTVNGTRQVLSELGITPLPLGIAGSNVTSTPPINDNVFLTYTNSEFGFKIKYPANWSVDEGPVVYPNSTYTEAVRFFPNGSEFASVALIVDPDRLSTIPDLLADSTKEYQSHDTLKNFNIVESTSNALLAGNQAYELVFTASDDATEYKNKEKGISVGGKAYYITYLSDNTNYEKRLPQVEPMYDSFELISTGNESVPSTTTPTNQTTTLPPPPTTASPNNDAFLLLDTFDPENKGTGVLNYQSFSNWIVKNGTVDLIGNGFYDMAGASGLFVDLDGSTADAGILESKEEYTLNPGKYVLEFDISGTLGANTLTVQLGNVFKETLTKEGESPFEHIVRTISIAQPITAKLSFVHEGGDNYGIKIDNVKLYKSDNTAGSSTTPGSSSTSMGPTPNLPVILVHGWNSDSSDWNAWKSLLQRDGLGYYPIAFEQSDDSCGSVADHAEELRQKIEQIKSETGQDKVNIVGYSKGGLDARMYLANELNDDDVANLIMIGTPNAGTPLANLGSLLAYCTPGLYDLLPDATATLAAENPNTNYYTIAGDWNSAAGGSPLIEGSDDGYVAVSSVESQNYFESLGHTQNPHEQLVGETEYNLARKVLLDTGGVNVAPATTTTTPPPPPEPATTTTTPPPPPPPPEPATTTTTLVSPSVTSTVDLHPESTPSFFKCKETPDEGLSLLPGFSDVYSSANAAVTDKDPNTEILGKAIFDVTFTPPLINNPDTPEIAVHEIGNSPESFKVATMNSNDGTLSDFKEYSGQSTGTLDNCGYTILETKIDLDDFGIGEGDTINTLRINNNGQPGCCAGADIGDIVVIMTEQSPTNIPVSPSTTTTTTIPPEPTLPEAMNVTVETESNIPVEIQFDLQDDDNNSDLTASITEGPTNGQLGEIDQSTGTVAYTPNPDFAGEDQFRYTVNDGTADSNVATVSITVIPQQEVEDGITIPPSEPGSTPQDVSIMQGVWDINANNLGGVMIIKTIDSTGHFTGTVGFFGYTVDAIDGQYDSESQLVTFVKYLSSGASESYTGQFDEEAQSMSGTFTESDTGAEHQWSAVLSDVDGGLQQEQPSKEDTSNQDDDSLSDLQQQSDEGSEGGSEDTGSEGSEGGSEDTGSEGSEEQN